MPLSSTLITDLIRIWFYRCYWLPLNLSMPFKIALVKAISGKRVFDAHNYVLSTKAIPKF